ncbi:MAG: Fimbrillin-like [Bacteroidetes bacterium]|nr:Fimbrillin-like [Bacteroidota bacterium]
MRKQLVSVAFLSALALASCSKDESLSNESKVPVSFSTSVQTRASVEGSSFADGTEIGVFATPGAISPTAPAWAATNFIQNDKSTVTSGVVTTSTTYWYGISGEQIKVAAYYPYSTNVTTAAGAAPVVNYTITGQEDLMAGTTASPLLDKTLATTPANSVITFNHLLTQLKFSAIAGAGSAGMNITKISVAGKNSFQVSLGTYEATAVGTTTGLFDAAILNGGAVAAAGTTAAQVGGAVMVEPGLNKFDVIVTLGGTATFTVPVAPASGTFEKGKSYNVIFTINKSGISATAVIVPWADGGNASGTIG